MERFHDSRSQNGPDSYSSGYPGMGLEEDQWFSVQGDVDDFIFYEPDPLDGFPFRYGEQSRR